jgi:hypothetical protein
MHHVQKYPSTNLFAYRILPVAGKNYSFTSLAYVRQLQLQTVLHRVIQIY